MNGESVQADNHVVGQIDFDVFTDGTQKKVAEIFARCCTSEKQSKYLIAALNKANAADGDLQRYGEKDHAIWSRMVRTFERGYIHNTEPYRSEFGGYEFSQLPKAVEAAVKACQEVFALREN